MLKEPDFEEPPDGKSYVCIDNGEYHAYLDRDGAIAFLFSLHWFHSQQMGEEIDIGAFEWEELPKRGKRIGYCEFNLTPNHAPKKGSKPAVRHKPHGAYSPGDDRLDYFVSPNEVAEAYETLTTLLKNCESRRPPLETVLFGTLHVHLVLDPTRRPGKNEE